MRRGAGTLGKNKPTPSLARATRRAGPPPTASAPPEPPGRPAGRSYRSGAGILSVGIAATGVLTFAYFSIASHVLGAEEAKRIDVLWAVMFVIISVIYRPVEQLLSRTIAQRRARGQARYELRVPIAIQGSFALLFLIAALALREPLIDHVFHHNSALYWVLVVGTLAYAASYFARGWLAGHEHFALFGGLVLMESASRLCFALAVALGIASGQTAVALGIAAAPLLSLMVVPAAFLRGGRRRAGAHDAAQTLLAAGPRLPAQTPLEAETQLEALDATLPGPSAQSAREEAAAQEALSLRQSTGFAVSVSSIMLSEQALLNAAVLTVAVTSRDAVLAGIVFNVLLISRAPLQLFQAIQTSLLPHLAGLEVRAGHAQFARAVRVTVLAIALFAGVASVALLLIGPAVMEHVLFGQHYSYGRVGLALVGIAMGMHLTSGTLNQAALARNRAQAAAACWLVAAAGFIAWMLVGAVHNEVLRTEIGYLGATTLLALLLGALYRRGQAAPAARAIAV